MDEVGVFEAIHTQRGITRYKPDPVPIDLIQRVVEAATKAPSGSNLQGWEFVVITKRERIEQLAALYREAFLERNGEPHPGEGSTRRAARHLADHMHEVPAMILVCADHTRGPFPFRSGDPVVRNRLASSVWPAVQNLFLAARGLGLGTRLTGAHSGREADVKALLGIPDHIETVMLTPLGYPDEPFTPPRRRPASEVTSYDVFGNRTTP